jgi:hypothetical protein
MPHWRLCMGQKQWDIAPSFPTKNIERVNISREKKRRNNERRQDGRENTSSKRTRFAVSYDNKGLYKSVNTLKWFRKEKNSIID